MTRSQETTRRIAAPVHPVAAAAFSLGLVLWLLALDQPAAVVGGAIAAFAWLARGGQFRQTAALALIPALMLTAINAFFSGCGESIVLRLPPWWPGARAITWEAVAFGSVAGAKLAAVMASFALWAMLGESDRTIGLLGRVAPRTAVTLGIAIRLIPGLLRDARRIQAVLWSRGIDLRERAIRKRAAAAGLLWRTLLASALESAKDLAEALAARGFGSGPRSSLDPDRLAPRDWVPLCAGCALVVTAMAVAISGAGQYHFYPRLAAPHPGISLALAAVPIVAAAVASAAWRGPAAMHRHAHAC